MRTNQTRKRPAFLWYPGDSRRDTAIQSCSLEARGLWREMLDLMHDGAPYGHLAVSASGDPITVTELARLVSISPQKTRKLLDELRAKNVFSETPTGVIYSRRMVRDEIVRNKRAEAGVKSLENPNVPRPKSEGMAARDSQEMGTLKGYPSDRPSSPSFGDSSRPSLAGAVADAVAFAVAVAEKRESGTNGTASPLVEEFRNKFYRDEARWSDVLRQLDAVAGPGYTLTRKGKPNRLIRASRSRIEQKIREVLAHPPRDPNAAILILLEKLSDAETDAQGRTVTEARAAEDKALIARETREGEELVARFKEGHPELYRRIEEGALQECPTNGPMGDPFREAWIRSNVMKHVEQMNDGAAT